MDKAHRRAAEYCLLWLSVLFAGASVAAWYSYVFHGAQASWVVFSGLMIILAAGPVALWLINYSKWYGEFSRGWILFRTWCGLISGWAAYLLVANNRNVVSDRTVEPWLLVGCFAIMLLASLTPVLVKLVRTTPRKE